MFKYLVDVLDVDQMCIIINIFSPDRWQLEEWLEDHALTWTAAAADEHAFSKIWNEKQNFRMKPFSIHSL